MKVLKDWKTAHIIEQLQEKGYTDIEGKTYDELKHKLAVIRALEIDVSSDSQKWF